jgi:hypothetical protein
VKLLPKLVHLVLKLTVLLFLKLTELLLKLVQHVLEFLGYS